MDLISVMVLVCLAQKYENSRESLEPGVWSWQSTVHSLQPNYQLFKEVQTKTSHSIHFPTSSQKFIHILTYFLNKLKKIPGFLLI